MSTKWSDEVKNAERVVKHVIKSIDEDIQVFTDCEEGFKNDTFEVVLVKGGKRVKAIVSWEEIVNAGTNSADLEYKLRNLWEA